MHGFDAFCQDAMSQQLYTKAVTHDA